LIKLPADKHLWAQSYEGDIRDVLTLQNKVARAIAEQIQANLNRQEQAALEDAKAVNPEAYQAYLKGRYFLNKRTGDGLRRAIEYFNSAIETDPTYAEAYSGLADAYALSGDWKYGVISPQDAFPKTRAAAIASARPTPLSLSLWTFMAGTGRPPRRNTSRQSS
jgi:tetratricopeptide (TPR) repeat protein